MATGAWAAEEIVDLDGKEVTYTDSESFGQYVNKVLQNGTINLNSEQQGSAGWMEGTYTIGSGATVNCEKQAYFNNTWTLNIAGGKFNMTSSGEIFYLPFRCGNVEMNISCGGMFTSAADLWIGGLWNNKSQTRKTNNTTKFVMTDGSKLSIASGKHLKIGTSASTLKANTVKNDIGITNSFITLENAQILLGENSNDLVDETEKSYTKITFGPGAVITSGQIYAYKFPTPSVTFDGATFCRADYKDSSFIGHDSAIGDIYTIDSLGLTVDIPSGKSLTCDTNASSLKGTGGITKIGAGSITWNKVSSNGSKGMTFTGPLVVSNGTWTSTLGYAASAFRADGGKLVLSGALSAARVAFAATEGGSLTLAGATITDDSPDMTLAGGGKTDYFTRDGKVDEYTLDSLTLGEDAVLDLDANATAVDAINATTTTITATSDNPATININFSAAPSAGATFTLLNADSADVFTVVPKFGDIVLLHEESVVDGRLVMTIVAEDYIWKGMETSLNWGDENAWTKGGADATWSDGNNAIFATPKASVSLSANAMASKVSFTADATVFGSGELTAFKVNVSDGVSAVISAPMAGMFEKTGAGTLTLGAERKELTVVTEGTIAFPSGVSADLSLLKLGTDPLKAVALDYGAQELAFNPASNIPAHMDVALANGEFTNSGTTYIEDSTMRVAAGASFVGTGWICVGGKSSSDTSSSISACLVVDGGAVTNSANNLSIGDYGAIGSCSKVLVTNGGEYYSANYVSVAQGSTGYLIVDASRVTAISELRFCNEVRCVEGENGYVSVTNGGEIVTKAVKYGSGAGNGYFDFDGGTLKAQANGTLISAHDRLFVSVNAEGGTIDNGGNNVIIAENLLGAGAVTNKGAGSITYSVNQTGTGEMVCEAGETVLNAGLTVARPVTVKEGAKFSVKASEQVTLAGLTLEKGSILNIDSYILGVTPFSAESLTLPAGDTVSLTKDDGVFGKGIYQILSLTGIKVADVQDKLIPAVADGSDFEWIVNDGTLILAVGSYASGGVWTGFGGDGKMSTGMNWLSGSVPEAGATLDFSSVTAATTVIGDVDETFGAVTMGDSVITFTGEKMKATSFSDTRKVAVDVNSSVVVDGHVTINFKDGDGIVNKVDEGGKFVVNGTLTITGGSIHPVLKNGSGYIVAGGLVANSTLYSTKDATSQKWVIGSSGITGDNFIWCLSNSANDCWIYPDNSDFAIAVNMVLRDAIDHHELNTTGYGDGLPHTITLKAGLADKGHLYIAGTGKVVVDSLPAATGDKSAYSGNVTVQNAATLAINKGMKLTTGKITFASGTALEVPSTGVEMGAIAFSGEGTVMLKVAAGDSALDAGTYTLVTSSSTLPNNVLAKFSLDASLVKGDADAWLEVGGDGKSLVLNIGDRSQAAAGVWIGGSGDFSTAANWKNGQVPVEGGELDFSGVTANMTINCGDLSNTKFGAVNLGTAKRQITINGTLRVASMTVEKENVNFSVASDSKLIVDGDVTLTTNENQYLYIVYENNGRVEIGGKVVVGGKAKGYSCFKCSEGSVIALSGVENSSTQDRFKFNARQSSAPKPRLIVGKDGFVGGSGASAYWVDVSGSGTGAILQPADSDFAIGGTDLGIRNAVEFYTTDTNGVGRTVTINATVYRLSGSMKVSGKGTLMINYDTLSKSNGSSQEYFNGAVTVSDTATLAVNAGKVATIGMITVNSDATLQVAQSAASARTAAVTLGGGLTLKNGACLGFNYTTRNAPVLDLSDKTVTFEEGETKNVIVKITADEGKRPFAGENVLTCGGNFSEDVALTLAEGAPNWVKRVYVNDDGNIAIDVKPIGTKITVR